MVTNNKDLYNIRVGSEDKKKEFKRRTANIKEECKATPRDIYEAGLKVFEEGDSEAQILYRRNKTVSERDTFFNLFIDRNKRITAFNRQLRNKNKRYKDYTDEKDVVFVFDEEGKPLETIPKKQGKFKVTKLEFF